MHNILLKYFPSVFSLESFLHQINFTQKLDNYQLERLKFILKNLSNIYLAFNVQIDLHLTSKSTKKYSFEKFFYKLLIDINKFEIEPYTHHMLKCQKFIVNDNFIHIEDKELLNILLRYENLTLCYFLNTNSQDALYWKQLHAIIGDTIFKVILIHGYLFKRVNRTKNSYVQLCGIKLNMIYHELVDRVLSDNEKKMFSQFKQHKNKELNNIPSISKENKDTRVEQLSKFFDNVYNDKANSIDLCDTLKLNLQKLGNRYVAKERILYSRKINSKIPNRFLINDKKLTIDQRAQNIVRNLILVEASGDSTCSIEKILVELLKNFIQNFSKCPIYRFRYYYCESIKRFKRKRGFNITKKAQPQFTLHDFKNPDSIYCFIIRVCMFCLNGDGTKGSFELFGGKKNFFQIRKFIKKLIYALKYDHIKLNEALNGIKLTKITYLKQIKSDRLKQLLFLCVIRWFIEDFVFVLIKSHFYVTDTSSENTKIFYYLKKDWKCIVRDHFLNDKFKNLYNLEKISLNYAKDLVSKRESSGIHMGMLFKSFLNPLKTVL
jgi:hypothetical protein